MGISNAMTTGVSGLMANADKTTRISENIANANTVGYKRAFSDMVTTRAGGGASVAGVEAVTRNEISRAGTPIATNSPTDLAVSGEGFFIVSKTPNDPVEANYMLTRAGSFKPDADGNLRNAAGYYLAGLPYGADGAVGAVDRNGFAGLQTVSVADDGLRAQPTTEMSVSGNLPAQATGAGAGAPFVSSKSVFDALGGSQRVQFAWQPGMTENDWTLTISDGAGGNYGSVDIAFSDGATTPAGTPSVYSNVSSSATAPATFAFDTATGVATVTPAGGASPPIDITLGAPGNFDGITQFDGDFTPQTFNIDGSGVAALSRTEITEAGDVMGVYDNGQRRALFQIPLGTVTNPDGLARRDGNAFALATDAGIFTLSGAGESGAGDIAAQSLEGSNVDIATELTDLIQTQRAYSSNAKVVQTADEMLAETTQLKR